MLRKILLSFSLGLLFLFSLAVKAESVNALLHASNDPVAGNPKGKITVVEFFDYQCGHCMSMAPVIASIIKNNPNVRVVFKDFPIRGPVSEFAARAALAANKQGKYYEFNHALLTANQPLTEQSILEIAKSTGLNIKQLKKDMDSKAVENQLKANFNLALNLKLTGTPAFFISKTDAKDSSNINFILGEMSQSELQSAIDNASK